MSDHETLTQLLMRWRGRRLALLKMAGNDYSDPEKNKVIMTMEFQLRTCIEELEQVMSGSWLVAALAKNIEKANKTEEVRRIPWLEQVTPDSCGHTAAEGCNGHGDF